MSVRKQQVFRIDPAGLMDRTDSRVLRHTGQEVHIVQPPNTPRNGTFGMVYVQHAESGEFIGLVSKQSLVRVGNKRLPVRDLAAEAREARRPKYNRTGPSPFQVVGRVDVEIGD
jgi:hypothetical protein